MKLLFRHLGIAAAFLVFPTLAFASYQPGQTLDPSCPPTDNTCVVVPSVTSSQWTTTSSNISYTGGNVGIGTTTPATPLQIAAAGNAQLRLGDNTGVFYFDLGRNAGTGAFTIQGSNTSSQNISLAPTSGNVGIGTTSPGSKLSVAGSGYFTGNVTTGSLLTVGSNLKPYIQNAFAYNISTTQGSNQITLLSLSSCPSSPSQSCTVVPELPVFSSAFPQPAWVVAVNGTTVTMSENATVTNASVSAQFSYNRYDATSALLTNIIGANQGYFGSAAAGGVNWPNEYLSGSVQPNYAQLYVVSTSTSWGIYAASRTSDNSLAAQELLSVNDSSSHATNWGQYIESHSTNASTGLTFNGEYSILNQGAVVANVDPFDVNVNGMTVNLRLDCGTGAANPLDCSNALQILNNGARYAAGIVIANNSLATSTYANPPALELPAGANGYAIDWLTSAGNIGWSLFSNDTSTSNLKQIQLGNTSLSILNSSVGIGTTTPTNSLSILTTASGVGGTGAISIGNAASPSQAFALRLDNTAANLTIDRESGNVWSTALTVQRSSGNVGIGTTTPGVPLQIASGGNTQLRLSDNTGGFYFDIGRNTGTGVLTIQGNNTSSQKISLAPTGGNVGVGTTSPYAKLSVWGTDAASSTLAFNIVNSASTTAFAVFNGGNAQLSGSLTQSSDRRLKTNINALDGSSSLDEINKLQPVTYNWRDPEKSGTLQYGFIAQDVQQVLPDLVSTTSATALTPNGTLGLNYLGILAPLVKAVQALSNTVTGLQKTINGFADVFTTHHLHSDDLCLKKSDGSEVCVTGDELNAFVAGQNQPQVQVSAPVITVLPPVQEEATTTASTTASASSSQATSTSDIASSTAQ